MASAFSRSRTLNSGYPVSPLGPGYAGGPQGLRTFAPGAPQVGSMPQAALANAMRGTIPVIMSFSPDDTVEETGRINGLWVPVASVLEVLSRQSTSTPTTPLLRQGTIGDDEGDTVTLTIQAPTPTSAQLADASYTGFDLQFLAAVIDINTNNNINTGPVTLDVTGQFVNGFPYTQHIVLSPGHLGTSRYALTFTQETQGGAYPTLARVSRDLITVAPGAQVAVQTTTPALSPVMTSIQFTNGLRSPNIGLSLQFSGFVGTGIVVRPLTPATQLWDDYRSMIYNSIRAAQIMSRQQMAGPTNAQAALPAGGAA